MTQYEPTLLVRRLVVVRGQQPVSDQQFHMGVNALRGENSSGKSTILNFIFYALGGDLAEWSETALLCDRVFLEAAFNGVVVVLAREVSSSQGQPMEVFSGGYEASTKAPRTDWMRFPYKRSENTESFSQVLFRLLKIPEVKDESGNLTMHQLLRLLYADQLSPTDDLFRFERFDPPQMRVAVGRLLVGAFDNTLYENERSIRILEKEFEGANAEFRSLSIVAGSTGEALTAEWLAAQRSALEDLQRKVHAEIEEAESEIYVSKQNQQMTLQAQRRVYEDVKGIQHELSSAARGRDNLFLAKADSDLFIGSLERKLMSLQDASATAKQFSDVIFDHCPCCYAALESVDANAQHCQLCKSPLDSESARSRLAAMITDAATQVKQSKSIQSQRIQRIEMLNAQVAALNERWKKASIELTKLERLPSTAARGQLRSLHAQAGYVQRQIEDLSKKSELIERLAALARKKDTLNDQINKLKSTNELLLRQQTERIQQGYTAIADEIRKLLRNDLPREMTFQKANVISFDFMKNHIVVDGTSYFSASSRVVLKSSFFLGFLAAATKNKFFRHPRFLMLDTIEDKGMEVERSHNFQRQILRISNESPVEHQIIYATSMIAPELDNSKVTVGHFSKHENPTLKISSALR